MKNNGGAFSGRNTIIWIGVFIGFGFYVADIIIDVFIFRKGTLIEETLSPAYHEVWMRTSVLLVAIAFAFYVKYLLGREQRTNERTKTADIFLNSVFDNIPNMVFIKDADELRFLRVNHAGETLLGLKTRDLLDKNDHDLFPVAQADFFTKKDREVLESGVEANIPEEEIDTATLGKRWLHTRKVPILDNKGKPIYLLGISEDITEARQAIIDRQQTETRFQTLFDSAAEFIFVINPEGMIINANSYVYEHSGYDEDEVIGSNIKDFFTESSKNICDCNFPGLRERGYNRADIEFVCKDGHIIDMECSATGVSDEEGNFTTFLIIQRDMTERKRDAAALANSERRFRTIFNSSFQLIGVLNPEGMLLEVNQTALDLGGLSKEDVVGRPLWDTYWWCYSSELQDRLKAGIRKASQGEIVSCEENVRAKHNVIRTIDFSLNPVMNESGEVTFIIPEGRDITDKKKAEEDRLRLQNEMAHVNRLCIVGEMASSMAHELNQPLTALVSYCGTAMTMAKSSGVPDELSDVLKRASEQAHRAGDVIHHLREFSSKGSNNKSRNVLDDMVNGVIDFIGWELRDSDVQLSYRPAPLANKEVFVDKIQIEQVLVNLIRNSIEAIMDAGITGGQVDIASRQAGDDKIEVTITDNGPGINPAVAGTLFDLYQTSKKNGMGMGLPISRSIIEAHDGSLWLDDKMHQGATFHLSLPGRD